MKCEILNNNIKLDKPFRYFLGELYELPYSKVVITDNNGVVGAGEVAHAIDINGELQEGAKYFAPYVENALSSFLSVDSVADISVIMENVRLLIAHNTGLMCGVEQALFSILSQKKGENLTQLLGKNNDTTIFIQTTIPYLLSLDEYKNTINKIVNENNPKHVKFKVGKNLELELSAIQYLSEINKMVSISVDANQAFDSADKAITFSNALLDLRVAWAEQLLHKDNITGLRELKAKTKLPVMIDEGLHTPLEAEFYAKEKLADYFNIKLAKTGGILNALEIIRIAKEHNIPYMLGSMLQGKLGIEYNLGFALSQDFVTNDFFSYFSVEETKNLNYINPNLTVTSQSLYGEK